MVYAALNQVSARHFQVGWIPRLFDCDRFEYQDTLSAFQRTRLFQIRSDYSPGRQAFAASHLVCSRTTRFQCSLAPACSFEAWL